jgi:hypothetical protein
MRLIRPSQTTPIVVEKSSDISVTSKPEQPVLPTSHPEANKLSRSTPSIAFHTAFGKHPLTQ